MRRDSRSISEFRESHTEQYLKTKIEQEEFENWCKLVKINPERMRRSQMCIKTDTCNPFSEESKRIIHNLGRSLQRRNALFGQKMLARALYCICGQCLLPSEKQKRMTKEKFDLLSTPCFIIKMEHLAVQNTESSKNSMTISRQWTLRKCEQERVQVDFGKISEIGLLSRFTDGRWVDGRIVLYLDQVALEDKSYMAVRRERSGYENNWKLFVNAKGLVSPMDKRDDYPEAVKSIKNLRQQADQPGNPPILHSYRTRQRPFEERQKGE